MFSSGELFFVLKSFKEHFSFYWNIAEVHRVLLKDLFTKCYIWCEIKSDDILWVYITRFYRFSLYLKHGKFRLWNVTWDLWISFVTCFVPNKHYSHSWLCPKAYPHRVMRVFSARAIAISSNEVVKVCFCSHKPANLCLPGTDSFPPLVEVCLTIVFQLKSATTENF